ncbi:DUF3313 family protein [Altererythrobacter sp. Root672]|uniref:DUF3313 family protein n=1 Tax=Altererythrobacter sp. Root672 TaxID=1736584 RepID=UPI0006F616B9|nr:DUF3313 family protein [Altererythrobacter sp. Root672]KRA80561.1 hypothetical protein ASD76_15495 [Altererythrobacter sp. Root672]
MPNPKLLRRFVIAPLLLAAAVPLVAQPVDGNWDGLLEVKAKKMDKVYLLPNADFRTYTKVMIDPTEVSFKKNWQRDQNRDRLDLANRVDDSDARRIIDAAQKGFDKYFAEAYTKAGFQVVQAPGPDVLHLSTAIINLDVTAPDVSMSAGSRTFSRDAGEATLVLEAKDSVSGQVLGRAVDRQESSDMGPYLRNSVTNSAAFEEVFKKWAERSAEGLSDLKELSPVNPSALQAGN